MFVIEQTIHIKTSLIKKIVWFGYANEEYFVTGEYEFQDRAKTENSNKLYDCIQ